MKTSIFDFRLPAQLIAQEPLPERDASRLLVLDRGARVWSDRRMGELPELLQPGDLVVLNDTRVIPARLRALRDASGGKVEFLLLPPETERGAGAHAEAQRPQREESKELFSACSASLREKDARPEPRMLRPAPRALVPVVRRVLTKAGGKLRLGETFTLSGGCKATLAARHGAAGDTLEFHCAPEEFERLVRERGEVPLPPYIHRPPGPSAPQDKERYQTVYAHSAGAVAAPTAGLHFTARLLETLKARGVKFACLTLHVGPGTFRPVKSEDVEAHFVDPEPYLIPADTMAAVRSAKQEGRRVVAVGTTSLRALEGAAAKDPQGAGPLWGATDLFVYPPFQFRVVGALLTNFHIPRSSLLMLACAFAAPGSTEGIEYVKRAYAHAVESGYRFYSYGDACLFV